MFRTPVSVYMTPDPATVKRSTSLEEVAKLLELRGISAMPVIDEAGKPIGIISRRDLLRVGRLAGRPGAGPRLWKLPEERAGEVMSEKMIMVSDTTSLKEAAAAMLDNHVHRVFVERRRALRGVLTTKDVMQAIVDERYQAPIHRFMSSPVETIAGFEPLGAARLQLESLGVRGLVVTEEGWPIGMFAEEEALASRHHDPELPVDRVMGHEVLIQSPDVRANRAAGRMASMHARRIVVVEQGELQGILTGFDLAGAAAVA